MTSNSIWKRLLYLFNKYCGLWLYLHIFQKFCTFNILRAVVCMWNMDILVNFAKCSTGTKVSVGCCAYMPLSIMPHFISVSSNKCWSTSFPVYSCNFICKPKEKAPNFKRFSQWNTFTSSIVCNYLGQLGGLILCTNFCSLYAWLFFLRKANMKCMN